MAIKLLIKAHHAFAVFSRMMEGVQPFHAKSPEEAVRMMCREKVRPQFKSKAKSFPPELKEANSCRLIDECWHPESLGRPTFLEIIERLDKIVATGSKQGWWTDTFKLPWK